MSEDRSPSLWRRAVKQISTQAQEFSANAQQAAETMKRGVEGAQSTVTHLTERAVELTQQTVSATSDSISSLTEQTTTAIQNATQSAADNIQTLQQDTQRLAQRAQEQVSLHARQATHHVEGVIHFANNQVADQIDRVAGERGESASSFVRDGGLVSVAGFVFKPIALAQRGIDSYHAYHQFMRGEITLGVCLLNLISPSIIDTQAYLKDPDHQAELLEGLHKFIPAEILEKIFGSTAEWSGQVGQTLKDGPLSGEALQRFDELMNYRRPQVAPEVPEAEPRSERATSLSDSSEVREAQEPQKSGLVDLDGDVAMQPEVSLEAMSAAVVRTPNLETAQSDPDAEAMPEANIGHQDQSNQ